MKLNRIVALLLALVMLLACSAMAEDATQETTITDMIGREVSVTPGSYRRVVCIGAGALRLYSYVGDVALLAGVEDIDNTSLATRPKMFDSVARPYLLANEPIFAALPSCGVGGPNAQTAEAEKILTCDPDIVISEYEDKEKENALQEQLGVPVVTVRYGTDGVFDESVKDSLTLLGKIFRRESRAAQLNAYIAAETAEIASRVATVDLATAPVAYICGLGNWGTTNHLMTAQGYKPFELAKVRGAVTGLSKNGITPILEEKLQAIGGMIDLMFIDAAAIKNILPLYREDPTMFDEIKAWTNGDVYLEMAYNAYYTNLEIALINAWYIAKTAHPDLFSDVDMKEKTAAVTEAFLGKDLSDAIYAAPSSFGGYRKLNADFFAQ